MHWKIGTLSILFLCAVSVLGQTPAEAPKTVTKSERMLNLEAVKLPPPNYPSAARAAKASGQVVVKVVVGENGRVEKAEAIGGNPLLRTAAEEAARKAEFNPTGGQKLSGILLYNFSVDAPPASATRITIRPNWVVIAMSIDSLTKVPTLRFAQPEMIASQIPREWVEEQNQLAKIRELKEAELSNGNVETLKTRELSDGRTKVISGPVNKTASPEAEAIGQSLIASIKSRIGDQPLELWYFNLGLELNRAADKADSRDIEARMATVRPFKDYIASAPADASKELIDALNGLYSLMEKGVFSDEDKMAFTEATNRVMNLSRSQ